MKNESGCDEMGMLSAVGIRPVSWSSEGSRVSLEELILWRNARRMRRAYVPIKTRSLEGFEMRSLICVSALETLFRNTVDLCMMLS